LFKNSCIHAFYKLKTKNSKLKMTGGHPERSPALPDEVEGPEKIFTDSARYYRPLQNCKARFDKVALFVFASHPPVSYFI
jgi:hypothetical protein